MGDRVMLFLFPLFAAWCLSLPPILKVTEGTALSPSSDAAAMPARSPPALRPLSARFLVFRIALNFTILKEINLS